MVAGAKGALDKLSRTVCFRFFSHREGAHELVTLERTRVTDRAGNRIRAERQPADGIDSPTHLVYRMKPERPDQS
jgi:hypothetical protein